MVRVIDVKPGIDYKLEVVLDNGKSGIFDVAPFLNLGIFQELKDISYFKQVMTHGRSIYWPHAQDFCADTIDELLTT